MSEPSADPLQAVLAIDPREPRAIAAVLARVLPEHGYQAVILLGGSWRQFMLSGGADGVIHASAPETDDDSGATAELAGRGTPQVFITDDAGPGSLAVRDGHDVVTAGTETPEILAGRAVTMLLEQLRG